MALKADGVRAWLFRGSGSTVAYTMTRDDFFRSVSIEMPENTVFDVEQMQDGTFLIFDVLAVAGRPVWHKSLDSRIEEVHALPLTQGLSIKQHHPLSDTQSLLGQRDIFDTYKIDGLVFTPNSSYCFDGAVPLFKLQRRHEISFDLDANQVQKWSYISGRAVDYKFTRFRSDVIDGVEVHTCNQVRVKVNVTGAPKEIDGIAVCVFEGVDYTNDDDGEVTLRFQHVRYDKRTSNADSTIESQLKLCVFPLDLSSFVPQLGGGMEVATSAAGVSRSMPHPAKSMAFDELERLLASSSEFNQVTDDESGLTVVNTYSNRVDPMGIARGLVLDRGSKEVVAVSFPRFYPYDFFREFKPRNDDGDAAQKKSKGSGTSSSTIVHASIKMDGSMIMAYIRHGRLYTNTKRRHCSEQAHWAKAWLTLHLESSGVVLNEGWTYVLEEIAEDNQIVMEYSYDSLVLLAVFDEGGRELTDLQEKSGVAEHLRLPLAPQVFARLETLQMPKYMKGKEGWVVDQLTEELGEGTTTVLRKKIINPEWDIQARAVKALTPVNVWRLLGQERLLGQDIGTMFSGRPLLLRRRAELPARHRVEWEQMAKVILDSFHEGNALIADALSHRSIVDQLVEVGVNFNAAIRAAIAVKDSTEDVIADALDWLSTHKGDADVDDPLLLEEVVDIGLQCGICSRPSTTKCGICCAPQAASSTKGLLTQPDWTRTKSIKTCSRCGCSSHRDEFGDRICFCDPCASAGSCSVTTISKPTLDIDVAGCDAQSASQISTTIDELREEYNVSLFNLFRPGRVLPGYDPPAFLKNNCAKGWLHPGDALAACNRQPLTHANGGLGLHENDLCRVFTWLVIEEKNRVRIVSKAFDEYIRCHMGEDLQRAFSKHKQQRQAELRVREAEEEKERRFYRDRAIFGGYGSPNEGYGYY